MCIKRCRHKESSGIHSFIHFRHWLYITMNWSLTRLFGCFSPSFSPQASINFAPLAGAQIDLGSLAPVRPSVRPSQQREPVRRRHYMLTQILPPRCLSKAPICIDSARFWKLSLSCANGDVINCTRSILWQWLVKLLPQLCFLNIFSSSYSRTWTIMIFSKDSQNIKFL